MSFREQGAGNFDQAEPRLRGAKISYLDTTNRAYPNAVNFAEFCNSCDNLVDGHTCKFHPGHNYFFIGPANFVERGLCYWATVNNRPGRMTGGKFTYGVFLIG